MSVDIPRIFTYFLAMVFSLTVHEAAHALSAKWRGDNTAESLGRLSLNPLVHIDAIGTVLLPLVGAIAQMPMIGWAKPVPIDPRRFRNMRLSHLIVAAAGPGSNLILCFLCAFLLGAYQVWFSDLVPPGSFFFPFVKLAAAMVWINAILAFFNLIPIPPLDGAAVLGGFLPPKMADAYEQFVAPYGFAILIALLVAGGLGWVGTLAREFIELTELVTSSFFLTVSGGVK